MDISNDSFDISLSLLPEQPPAFFLASPWLGSDSFGIISGT